MNRRRLLPWLGIAACLGLPGLLAWLTLPDPRISQQTFEQIQTGMRRPEVEALVGVPPGNYTGGRVRILHGGAGPGDHYAEWVGEEVAILVWLDDEGRVGRKECVATAHVMGRRSLLDRVRRWFGW